MVTPQSIYHFDACATLDRLVVTRFFCLFLIIPVELLSLVSKKLLGNSASSLGIVEVTVVLDEGGEELLCVCNLFNKRPLCIRLDCKDSATYCCSSADR